MEIPKSQEKLNIKKFSNKKHTKGQHDSFYEIRSHRNDYIGDIEFLEMNNQWYFAIRGGAFLSSNQIVELSEFIQKLPKNKSRYS